MGPFPWESVDRVAGRTITCPRRSFTSDARPSWAKLLSDDVLDLERTNEVFSKIEADEALSYRLPSPSATAGQVLSHAAAVFESLHQRHKPMTFKFGFSHCASFRWHNQRYGYKFEVNKFQGMIVVYAAADPNGPAFLEAALIQNYKSFLAVLN